MYMSWASVALPAPPAEVTNPAESGAAHGMGTRTVYINDTGVMANKDGTMYPAGTTIVKTIMDDANTFVHEESVDDENRRPDVRRPQRLDVRQVCPRL